MTVPHRRLVKILQYFACSFQDSCLGSSNSVEEYATFLITLYCQSSCKIVNNKLERVSSDYVDS